MIKAVFFDCYGVLVADQLPGFVDRYMHDERDRATVWKLDDEKNLGRLSMAQFFEEIAKLAHKTLPEVVAELGSNHCNQMLFDFIRYDIKPVCKVGIVSNMASDVLTDLVGRANRDLFDVEALSFSVGVIKPEPRIYLYAAEQLGLRPEQCLFIDDKQRYCDGAKDVGMETMLFTDNQSVKDMLVKRLGLAV